MEGAGREREGLSASPPARCAAPPSPAAASPHHVVDVAEDHEAVPIPPPTFTGKGTPEDSAPPPPPSSTPTGKPEGMASTTASTAAWDSDVKRDGKAPPPPPPSTPTGKPEGEASTTASTAASDSHVKRDGKAPPPPPPSTPTGKPEGEASTTASTAASDSHVKRDGKVPPPPVPPNPSTDGNPDDKAPTAHPPPPPPPLNLRGLATTTPTVLHTSKQPPLPASEASSSSDVNSTNHISSISSGMFEDDDTGFKLCAIELTNIEKALEEEIKLAKKVRNDNEIQRRKNEIELRKRGEKMDNREDEIAAKEQDLRAAELRDRERRLKYREDSLQNPLLLQEDPNLRNKDGDIWDKRQNIMAISLACGLSVLISMQPFFPPDYIKWIVGSFAIIWALATIAFPAGLFGTSRLEKEFSRHVSRITFTSFALFAIYILYILSQSPAPHSSDLAPSPPPVPSIDFNAKFYIGLGIFALACHICLWISGCVTGGDKDPELH